MDAQHATLIDLLLVARELRMGDVDVMDVCVQNHIWDEVRRRGFVGPHEAAALLERTTP